MGGEGSGNRSKSGAGRIPDITESTAMLDGRTAGKHNGKLCRPALPVPDFADAVCDAVDKARVKGPQGGTLLAEMFAVQFTMLLEEGRYGDTTSET